MKRIGMMGGTFDPIHYGHLAIAEAAGHEFGLEKVIFMPAGQPPHKKAYRVTNAEDRFWMVEAAIAGNNRFMISRLELDRPGPSYTVDTVSQLRELYPGSEIFVITGADAIVEILTWKQADRLAAQCSFIAATRPGLEIDLLKQKLAELPKTIGSKIITLEVPGIAVSSTEIRERVAGGKTIRYLLPEAVENYIYQRKLFNENM